MGMIDNIIIILLIVGAFIAGLRLADHYHYREQKVREYRERLADYRDYARWTGPGGPYVQAPAKETIGQEFMDKLRTHGRAVTRLTKQQ